MSYTGQLSGLGVLTADCLNGLPSFWHIRKLNMHLLQLKSKRSSPEDGEAFCVTHGDSQERICSFSKFFKDHVLYISDKNFLLLPLDAFFDNACIVPKNSIISACYVLSGRVNKTSSVLGTPMRARLMASWQFF